MHEFEFAAAVGGASEILLPNIKADLYRLPSGEARYNSALDTLVCRYHQLPVRTVDEIHDLLDAGEPLCTVRDDLAEEIRADLEALGATVVVSSGFPEPVIGKDAPDSVGFGRLIWEKVGISYRVRYGGDQHMILVGPNGKGKGTRVLIPNLLQMAGASLVVVDPKGENAAVTAPYRATLGPVMVLNPFGVLADDSGYEDLTSCGFNPLARLNPAAPDFNAKAGQLAEAMIPIEGKDPHWSLSGRALVAMLIMYEAIEATRESRAPSMRRVRALLCQDSGVLAGDPYGLPALALALMESGHEGLRNKAAQFTDWTNEIRSIVSTAKIQTECFDDTQIADDMEKDGIDFSSLKREPKTVYVILPPDMMKRHSKWLRLVITAALHGVLRPRKAGEPKTVFMLDEFFALGKLEIIESTWGLVRGYGVQMLPVLQDLTQLKALYPELWENFLGMAGVIAAFGPNTLTTAEWLSKRAGDKGDTVISTNNTSSSSTGGGSNDSTGFGLHATSSRGHNDNYGRSTSQSTSTSQVRVPFIMPQTLFGMGAGFMVAALDGCSNLAPIYAPPYYDIAECAARARDNPYYLG